jgi:hypothetical protein
MKKYKYCHINDENEETIGIVEAKSLDEAQIIASEIKRLPLESFLEIFKVFLTLFVSNKIIFFCIVIGQKVIFEKT